MFNGDLAFSNRRGVLEAFLRPFLGYKESEFGMYVENKSFLELKNL